MRPEDRSGTRARALMLCEIGMGLMSRSPDSGDLCISAGNGSNETFEPALRMSTGLIGLAQGVVRNELDVAFLNPSAMLTQAYRGTGMFDKPLDVRVLAIFPSWDQFVCAVHPRTGIHTFADLKDKANSLRISLRGDVTHGGRVLLDQMMKVCGFSLKELESRGATLSYVNRPQPHADAAASGEVDAVFDEGIHTWLPRAVAAGMQPIDIGESLLAEMERLGWRRAVVPASSTPGMEKDNVAIDFSGWALFTRASLSNDLAYRFCQAIADRQDGIPWEETYENPGSLAMNNAAAPRDVPLHPGAARWYREHGFNVPD